MHSYIADALDKFKVKFTPLDVKDIQKYVHHHLMHQNSTKVLNETEKWDECNSEPIFRHYSNLFDHFRYSAWLIKSDKAGTGKSLKVKRIVEQFVLESGEHPSFLTIPLQDKEVDLSSIVKRLRTFAVENDGTFKRIIHFDVSSEVVSDGFTY